MPEKLVNILLVEDDEVDAMNIHRAFKRLKIGNPLYIARDGLEALTMLRGDNGPKITPRPRIILLDLNMPRMNGIEFLQAIRTDSELKAISVFVLTTSNDERDLVAAYNLNVAGYILKPLIPDKFIESLSTLNIYWNLIEMP